MKWRDGEIYPCSCNGKNKYFQNDYTFQGNIQIQCNLYQIPNCIFHRTKAKKKKSLICFGTQRPWIATATLGWGGWGARADKCAGGIKVPDFRLYYKSTIIKTGWYLHKNKYNQWNRIKNPGVNSPTYGQLIYDKEGKTIQSRKDSLFNVVLGKLHSYLQRIKLEYPLKPYIKINSKYIIGLNVMLDTIKLLEESIGRVLFDVNHRTLL